MRLKPDWLTHLHGCRHREIDTIFAGVPDKAIGDALEVGAGDGYQAHLLARCCKCLVSTDIYDDILACKEGDGVTFEVCDAEGVDGAFPERQFDLVFSSNLLEHVPDPQRALRGMHRVLRDDGLMIHVMPSPLWKLAHLALYWPDRALRALEILSEPDGVRRLWQRIQGRPDVAPSVGPSAASSASHVRDNNPKLLRRERHGLLAALMPEPHGVARSNLEEIGLFSRRRWQAELERAGFDVVRVVPGPVCSGYGFGLDRVRSWLESRHVATEYVYVAVKHGCQSPIARLLTDRHGGRPSHADHLRQNLSEWWRAVFVDPFQLPPTGRPRVVIVVSTLPGDLLGGAQIQADGTARVLGKDYDVVVLSRALRSAPGVEDRGAYRVLRRPVLAWPRDGIDVTRYRSGRWRGVRGALDIALCLWQLRVATSNAQAVIGYQTIFGGLIAALAGRFFGPTAIVSIRNESEYLADIRSPIARTLSQLAWRLTDHVALQSAGMAQQFQDRIGAGWLAGSGLAQKVAVVPNGIDVPECESTGSRGGIVFVGRLHPIKGLDVLMSALREMPPATRPTITIVGDGPLIDDMRAAAAELPITLVGEVSHDDALAVLDAAGILVLPATGGEGMPNVVLEAMARGLAVVATPVGAVPSMIEHEVNGLLVPPGDSSALRVALDRLRTDDALRARLGAAARHRARAYSWSAVRGAVDELIGPARTSTLDPPREGRSSAPNTCTDRPPTDRGVASIEPTRVDLAVRELWCHLAATSVHEGVLSGPDPNGRLNFRVWRFIDNYAPGIRGRQDYAFQQGQGYWVLANLALYRSLGDERYRLTALTCANAILAAQREDGAWNYPRITYDRNGQVVTHEGVWASLGLLGAFAECGDERYLAAVRRWLTFVDRVVGYQMLVDERHRPCLAVNYYAPKPRGKVPNNTAALVNLASLVEHLTGDATVNAFYDPMVSFLHTAQTSTGEMPYIYGERQHYLCYQYNAYQLLDLLPVYRRKRDDRLVPLIEGMLGFLREAQAPDGSCRNSCTRGRPTFDYHAIALGHAYSEAHALGFGVDLADRAARAVDYVLARQRPDGTWGHSEGDYGVLADRQAYPRYLAMMLYHLTRVGWPDARPLP